MQDSNFIIYDKIKKIINLIPTKNYLNDLFAQSTDSHLYLNVFLTSYDMLQLFYHSLETHSLETAEETGEPSVKLRKCVFSSDSSKDTISKLNQFDRISLLINSVSDRLWELINTGHWSSVPIIYRQAFTLATYFKVIFSFINNIDLLFDISLRETIYYDLDYGLLIGCPLPDSCPDLLNDSLNILRSIFNITLKTDTSNLVYKLSVEESLRPNERTTDNIDLLKNPSKTLFTIDYFDQQRPVILQDCINNWPAMNLWHHSDYLINKAGDRMIPIEIGKNYIVDDWSQDLVKFKEFLNRQIFNYTTDNDSVDHQYPIEYLAQHNLFEQIPELQNDIIIPEYCNVTTEMNPPSSDLLNQQQEREKQVDVKAWIGPKGTISPLHYDDKMNLLCQVFGSKKIILAAPTDTCYLYPHNSNMLHNTSQIDAEHIDFEKFPLVRNVKFYEITLFRGEMLFIPKNWWHYVRSLDKSFSVSLWWHIMVLMESAVSGHQFNYIRERLGDKLEMIRFDPYIQVNCIYRERKKIRSMKF